MNKTKREQRGMRPLNQRYGFYVHLALFVIFAIISPADWYLRIVGLVLHFIAPYVWHQLFNGRRDEIIDNERDNRLIFWSDTHLGTYLATMTMLWANVTISLINFVFFWNPSLVALTIIWGVAVGLHRYVLNLIGQRNRAEARAEVLEEELAVRIATLSQIKLEEQPSIETTEEHQQYEQIR